MVKVTQSVGFLRNPITSLNFCLSALVVLTSCTQALAQSNSRLWTDASGTFKVEATLVEVKEDVVYLQSSQGKVLKIPVARLSKADQEFLKVGANPFEEVETGGGDAKMPAVTGSASSTSTPGATSAASDWGGALKIDWATVDALERPFNPTWNVTLPVEKEFNVPSKPVALTKKSNFFEGLRRLEIQPSVQRAVAGFTMSFGAPKPLSRLSLIDFASGKAIHTSQVEADMVPLCLIGNGSSILMQGASDGRGGFETKDQLQVWKLSGKEITRSQSWTPFLGTQQRFGRVENPEVNRAYALPNNRLLLKTKEGDFACIDVATRKPYWYTKLDQHSDFDVTVDGSLVAVVDKTNVLIVDPQAGKVIGSVPMDGNPHVAWPKIRWSPTNKHLAIASFTQLQVLDVESGKWLYQHTFAGTPVGSDNLGYPHEDYVLLNGSLLVHLPTQIKVCEYRDATIEVLGGTAFIGVQGADAGLVVASKIPHPAAEALLKKAQDDPSVFLIHPGVEVSIDASGAGQHAGEVAKYLEAAAVTAGYTVKSNAPISIIASITGPKQEAVSYIASGSYIATVYQSTVRMTWEGKDIWTASGSNVPGFLQTERGKSIQDTLNEIGKKPSLYVFEKANFPKLLQKPKEGANGPQRNNALMTSKFTLNGLVDSN